MQIGLFGNPGPQRQGVKVHSDPFSAESRSESSGSLRDARLTLGLAMFTVVATSGCPALGPPEGWECTSRESERCDDGFACLVVDDSFPKCFQLCIEPNDCPSGQGCSESEPEGVCLVHAPACSDHAGCWSGFYCNGTQCVKCDGNGTDPHCRDPLAPAGLSAAAGAEQVVLSWQAVEGATGYRVYMDQEPGVTEEDTEVASVAETTYTHTDLDSTRTYYYRVGATNRWADGPLSDDEASAKPLPPPPPEAPAGVAAMPGDAEVEVTWSPVHDADAIASTGARLPTNRSATWSTMSTRPFSTPDWETKQLSTTA